MKKISRFFFIILFLPAMALPQIHETVSVDMVNVYLSATDSKGRFITDLKPEELTLKEDGIVQAVSSFSNFAREKTSKLGEKDVPLSVAFVIDTSDSMGQQLTGGQQKIDIVKNGAFRLLDELREEDSMMLVTFNDTPTEVTPLTTDKKKMQQDLLFQGIDGGNTAVLDSIYFAMEKLKGKSGRKIIVICSDGEDTASYLHYDEVLSNLIASDITVLAFGTMALTSSSVKGRYVLEKMAEASGGYAFFPTSLQALDAVMEKLRQGMRSQYSLGYKPARAMDGKWRKIEISTSRANIKLRYREGYFAK
jgi:VWFA-related protein